MINSTSLKNTATPLFVTPLSNQVLSSLKKVPSYIWLLNRVTSLNLSLAQHLSLSLRTFKGVRQSQLKMRHPSQGSFVFSELTHATTRLKLRSPMFLSQGRRVRQAQVGTTRHTQPLRSNFLHNTSLWQPTHLLRKSSFTLLGPALRRRHLNKVAPTFMSLTESDKARTGNKLFIPREIPSKFRKSSSAEARLRVFTRYLKLRKALPLPLLGFRRRRRRLPKIPAYLFLGLRRPPLVILRTPFASLWKSFRKTTQKRRSKAKRAVTSQHVSWLTSGLFQGPTDVPRWRRVLPPRPKSRLKSASLRRWSRNLGRFRKKSLYSYFYKKYQRLKVRTLHSYQAVGLAPLVMQSSIAVPSFPTSSKQEVQKLASWTRPWVKKSSRSLRLTLRGKTLTTRISLLPRRLLQEAKLKNAFRSRRVLPGKSHNKDSLYFTHKAHKPLFEYRREQFLAGRYSRTISTVRKAPLINRRLFKLFSYRLKSKKSRRVFRNRKPFRLKWTSVTRAARRAYALSAQGLTTPALCAARLPTHRLTHSNLRKVILIPSVQLSLTMKLPSLNALSLTRSSRSHLYPQLLDNRTVLRVSPLYSSTFVTSMFSFIGYSLTSPSRISDITRSVTDYSTDLKYLIFPDVNAAKAAIFRRLNKQRFLMRARMHLFNKIQFGNIEKNPRLQLIHKPLRTLGNDLGKVNFSGRAALSVSRNWVLHNELRAICRSTYRTPRIGRIRFKPGYYRIWRLARASAREILGFTSRYQYSLTPKLQRHYFQARSGSQDKLSLTVEFALLTSHLIPDHWSLKELLSSHSVFLNGTSCTNPRLRLFCGDFLQLLINLKYYIALRWLDSWSVQKKTKVSKIFYRKLKPSPTNKAIKTVRKLPHWFFDLQYTHTDIPKYFEVDYFTLSVFLLHDYVSFERWLPSRASQLNPLVINMYNWKYIT